MANVALVKPLVEAILHLKTCAKTTDATPCKDCATAATKLAAVLSDATEVAEYLRNLGRLYAATVPVPGMPSSGVSLGAKPPTPR